MAYNLVTLGTVELRDADGGEVHLPAGKPFALLAYVVLSGEQSGRDELARLLWPKSEAARARQSVRHALWRLRQAMGEDMLANSDPVVLQPGLVHSDYEAVVEHLDRGELEEAHALVGGHFLADLVVPDAPAWTTWVDEMETRLRSRLFHAFWSRGLEARAAGRPEAALEDLDRAVEYAPHRPSGHTTLVETLLELSRLDDAAAALEHARVTIGDVAGEELDTLSARLDTLVAKSAHRRETERGAVPFVGRDRELSQLLAAWRVAAAGEPRVALISGETWTGKTRLAEEARRQVEAGGGAVVWGQAREPEQTLDWAVAAELARHLISMPGAAGISAGSDRLIRALVPSLEAGEPAPLDRGEFAAALAEAFRDLLSAVAYEVPLMVVVENAQWADAASLALLHRAVRHLEGDPVLLVLTRRTEAPAPALDQLTEALERAALLRRVRLQPLELEGSAAIVRSLTVPPAATGSTADVGVFHDVAGGVPGFLLSTLDHLRSEGRATLADGRYRLAPGAEAGLTLPPPARSVLFHRLDHLSDEAGRFAAALATRSGATAPEALGRIAGLEDRTAHAIAELQERGVCRTADHLVEFTHPLLAREATRRFRIPQLPKPLTKAALLAVVLLILAAATVVALMLDGPTGPPYGGGAVYVHTRDRVLVAPARAGTPVWQAEVADGAPPTTPTSDLFGPFRVTTGELLWFRKLRHPGGPYIARAFPDGSNRPVIRTPGDDNLGTPSPDGRYLLYRTENLETDRYDHDLCIARSDGAEPRLLYAGREKLDYARWSPDGRRIVFGINAPRDTLAIITPGGDRIRSFLFDEANQTSWCGGSQRLVAQIRRRGRPEVVLIDAASDSVRFIGRGTWPTCSPDGRAVAYLALVDGALAPVVQDIESGRRIPIELETADGDEALYLLWVPDAIGPVASSVEIVGLERPLYVGGRVPIEVRVRFSDDRVRAAPVAWSSLDPAIAFVDDDGVLYGNRAGHARVVASYRGWLVDTVQVVVRPGGPQTPLLADPLTRLDTARWAIIGEPEPAVVPGPDGPVLSLRGDGRYSDGIMTREPLVIGRGVTVELEFRMRLTRRAQQRLALALADVPGTERPPARLHRTPRLSAVYLAYPASELLKFDPSTLGVSFRNGYEEHVRVPERLPSDEWVHVALQIDASGAVEVFVDRQPVLEPDIRLPTEAVESWHVVVGGAAVDTELFVRNLVVWESLRYGP